MPLLEGESLTNVVSPIAYALARRRGGGGEFDGALHITNFRIALERTGPGKVCVCVCMWRVGQLLGSSVSINGIHISCFDFQDQHAEA